MKHLFLLLLASNAHAALWQQPSLPGVAGHVFVPQANHRMPATGEFGLIVWQVNPYTPDGLLQQLSLTVAGYKPGASNITINGTTVGAYLNSKDLIHGSSEHKMMFTPQVEFSPLKPFATYNAVAVQLNLEVPRATDAMNAGSNTYVNSDVQFIDPSGFKISLSAGYFFHGHDKTTCGFGVDAQSQSTMVNCPMLSGPYLTVNQGSATAQSQPWSGFKHFDYQVSKSQFAAALGALHQQYPSARLSMNPADYTLVKFHLNAELHYLSSPATLQWSMQLAQINLIP